MPLETGTYISDLNASNPAHVDGLNQADSHLRLIKSSIKATFPNINAAVTAADEDLNKTVGGKYVGNLSAPDGTSVAPSVSFGTDTTAGFYKGASTGQTAIAGLLRGSGAVPAGALVDWPKQPPRFSNAAVPAGGQASIDWLELDGSVYNISDFPDLGAFLGSTFGGNGTTTFGVPNTKDTGRFRRSRTATVAAGTYQANQIKTHAHTGGVSDSIGAHTHVIDVSNPLFSQTIPAGTVNGSGAFRSDVQRTGALSTDASATSITATSESAGTHQHTLTIPSGGDGGGSENRPEAFVVVACIKT